MPYSMPAGSAGLSVLSGLSVSVQTQRQGLPEAQVELARECRPGSALCLEEARAGRPPAPQP